jgi:hypothetical protein
MLVERNLEFEFRPKSRVNPKHITPVLQFASPVIDTNLRSGLEGL